VILHLLLLLLSVFAASTAVIMIKASTVHPMLLSAWRLFVAAVILTPLFTRDYRRQREGYGWADLRVSIVPGIVLGTHLMSWVYGARMTPTANASLIVNLVPVAMPFFLWFLVSEPISRNELIATGIALTGVFILTAADLNISTSYFAGDLICLASMLFYALYMALGRRNRTVATVWLYLVPLYYVAGTFCLVVALFFVNPIQAYPAREVLLILGLGIIPTVIGHSLLNNAMKHFRGQVVSILNMGQFIFAGIMAFLLFREVPGWPFYVASILLACSGWLVIRGTRKAAADALQKTNDDGERS